MCRLSVGEADTKETNISLNIPSRGGDLHRDVLDWMGREDGWAVLGDGNNGGRAFFAARVRGGVRGRVQGGVRALGPEGARSVLWKEGAWLRLRG